MPPASLGPRVLTLVPHVDKLIPPRGCPHALLQHAQVESHREFRVVSPPLHQGFPWSLYVPKADCHVVAAARYEVTCVRAANHLPHRVIVPWHHSHGNTGLPDIPHPHGLVHGARNQSEVLVLVPVAGQHLEVVRPDRQGTRGLPDVPQLERAIARGGRKRFPVGRAPSHGVTAVLVLGKCSQRSWRLEIPQLYRVVPARAQEAVPIHQVPIHAVHLVPVLLVTSYGVHLRRCCYVPHLDAPVSARRRQHVLIALAPRAVIQPVHGVERRNLSQPLWRHVQDILSPVPNDPKVLGRCYGYPPLVVGREFHRVPIELRLVEHLSDASSPPHASRHNTHARTHSSLQTQAKAKRIFLKGKPRGVCSEFYGDRGSKPAQRESR
mmetsp:Transcript_5267/g.11222  ORF Transcript_5267/g.11222 Transcript_5267/m.11222 type:complete len:380 (+) Transcript_5267:623-1762(+)